MTSSIDNTSSSKDVNGANQDRSNGEHKERLKPMFMKQKYRKTTGKGTLF